MADTESASPEGWQIQRRPPLMTRRFEFASYAQTREFLDQLAELSKRTGYFPDLNFGKTHVSVSIAPQQEQLDQADLDFATETAALADLARA